MKRPSFAITLTVLGLGLVLAFQNCGMQPLGGAPVGAQLKVDAKSVTADDLRKLNAQIDTLTALDLSCSSDRDCAAIAAGSRACGGPQRYVVCSTRNSRYSEILSLAEKSRQDEASFNRENGVVSICSIIVEPGLTCVSGQCKTNP